MDVQANPSPAPSAYRPEEGHWQALASRAVSAPPKSPLTDRPSEWWVQHTKEPSCPTSDVPVNETLAVDNLLERINQGDLLVVSSRRRNGLILFREFYAEFAGPGAAVGGDFDRRCTQVIPLGNLSLIEPDDHEEQQKALKIRLQWIRLTQNFTDQPHPANQAQMILEQFKTYFDKETIDDVPNEAFALMVGVLPQTVRKVRLGLR